MIRLDHVASLLTGEGPYATAYLDATLAKELGPQEVAARWRALRGSLEEQGADDATLDAMEAVAGTHTEIPGRHGQVLVGSGGTLRMDTVLPAPPRRQIARWAALPHLMPMVAQLGPIGPTAQDEDVLERFVEARGRAEAGVGYGFMAAGLADTVSTLRQAEVETLLIVDDPSSDLRCWIGPDPVHLALTAAELEELGVREPVRDRLDAALVRAAAGTGATVVPLAEGRLELPDGLGVTLRYPMVK